MKDEPEHSLSIWQIAISIVSMHYGIGTLIGSGQDISLYGPRGMLFAVSSGVGAISLLLVSNFYWKLKYPLWDLFEEKYGEKSAYLTSFLSSFWMIGLIAGFILGGSAALKVFGLNQVISVLLITIPIYLLSLITIESLSKVFSAFLLLGSFFLVIIFWHNGFFWILKAPTEFFQSIVNAPIPNTLSVVLNIVLITILGMDFHQFIVRAKSPEQAKKGILLSGIILFGISFIIGATVLSSLKMLPTNRNSIETIPLILYMAGTLFLGKLGPIFMLPIIFVAVGSGSGITKVISRSITDFLNKKNMLPKYILNAAILIIAFLISSTNSSVIQLVISFYALYIAAIFVPFMGFILQKKGIITIQPNTFLLSLIAGFFSALSLLVINIATGLRLQSISLYMILFGFLTSSVILFHKSLNTLLKQLLKG